MSIIDKYIYISLTYVIIIIILLLLSVDIFFTFLEEIKYLNMHNNNLFNLFIYIVCLIPKKICILSHWVILLSIIYILCILEDSNKLLIIQVSGLYIEKIFSIVLKYCFIFMLIIFIIGQTVVPKIENYIKNSIIIDKNIKKKIYIDSWFNNNKGFINVNNIYDKNFYHIFYYKVNKKFNLMKVIYIHKINIINNIIIEENVKIIYLNKKNIKFNKNSKVKCNIFQSDFLNIFIYKEKQIVKQNKIKNTNIKLYLSLIKNIHYSLYITFILYILLLVLFKKNHFYKKTIKRIFFVLLICMFFHIFNTYLITLNNIIYIYIIIDACIILFLLLNLYKSSQV